MKIFLIFIISCCFVNHCFCQINNVDLNVRLTPSPTVQNLGMYGNTQMKNSTGGFSKEIQLFDLSSVDIKYTPIISYYSNGFKLDDWGGEIGIGWTNNFSGMIQREVRSIPDESATSHPELSTLMFTNHTEANFNKMKNIQESVNNRYGEDPEYDIFHFNFSEISGSFIIKENVCKQLNVKDKLKIEILTTNPYTFKITNPMGFQYFFGQDNNVELTSYLNDNACDNSGEPLYDVPTAWFLTKIISPKGAELFFDYSPNHYSYMYDFNQKYNYKNGLYTGDIIPNSNSYNIDPINYFSPSICFREKETKTKYLIGIRSNNWNLSFTYSNRTDLHNAKLLQKITLKSDTYELIKEYLFTYSTITSNYTFESLLHTTIGSNSQSIKVRYFLSKVEVINSNFSYNFSYITPEILPHRFSFSKDILGYFNGYANSGLIPDEEFQKYILPSSTLFEGAKNLIPRGNRLMNINAKIGLLEKIIYPTGGIDSIVYEQNSINKEVTNYTNSNLSISLVGNNESEHIISSQTFSISSDQNVNLLLETGYDDTEYPYDNDGSFNWVSVELWNLTTNSPVNLGDISNPTLLFQVRNISKYLSAGQYQIRATLYGIKSKVDVEISYQTPTTIKTIMPFYGVRVQKIITSPLIGPNVVRKYNYNSFEEINKKIVFSNSVSSTIALDINRHIYINSYEFLATPRGGSLFPTTGLYHYFVISSKNLYNPVIFNNVISYSHITEFIDSNQSMFTARNYYVNGNKDGQLILGKDVLTRPLTNEGFGHGTQIGEYQGSISNGNFDIVNKTIWNYECLNLETAQPNFLISLNYNLIPSTSTTLDSKYKAYSVILTPLYFQWWRLNSVQYTNNANVSNIQNFAYDNLSHLLPTRISIISSDGSFKSENLTYPHDYIDSNGFIGIMKTKHLINYPIEKVVYKTVGNEHVILSGSINKYKQIGDGNLDEVLNINNLLPINLNSFKFSNAPMGVVPNNNNQLFEPYSQYKSIVKFHSYDIYGNPLEVKKLNMLSTVYLWGYSGEYPVAKIENATYEEVRSILTDAVINSFNSPNVTESTILNAISSLRNNANMKKAQVWTYTYKPLVGMTSEVDPRGIKTEYKYDGFQRLKDVLDFEGNVLKNYQYNYRP